MRLTLIRRAQGKTQSDKPRKTSWLLLGLLLVPLSPIPLLYAAEQTLDNTTTSPAQVAAQSKAKADDNSQPLLIDNVHAELTHIITSSDYAEAQERKQWQPIKQKSAEPNFWLYEIMLKVLKFLFGSGQGASQHSSVMLLPLLIKIVLVGALIAFVAWIVNNAAINGWFKTLRNPFNKRTAVAKFQPSVLAQSWERLPPHHLIPQTVQDLLAKNEIERAASVLYCGSLRWLKQAHGIAIVPATTEKQCLAQVQRIAKIAHWANVNHGANDGGNHGIRQSVRQSMNKRSQQPDVGRQNQITKPFMQRDNQAAVAAFSEPSLSELSASYIKQVVYLWLEVAYSLPHRSSLSTITALNMSISDVAQHWLDRLPLQAMLANQRSAIHGSAIHGSAIEANAHSGLNPRSTTAQGESS